MGVFFFLLLHLNVIRMTDAVHNEFDLTFNSSPSVTMRAVNRGIISKQLIRALGVDALNRGLGLDININMKCLQIMIRSLDLTKGVVEAFSKGAFDLCQKGVGITILMYCFLLRLTELVLGVTDFFLLILQDPLQQLRLLL